MLDNKGEISIAATDLLNTFELRKMIFGNEITIGSENFSETQVVTIEMKFKFQDKTECLLRFDFPKQS